MPDKWIPHCTLATRLLTADVLRVVAICQMHWYPPEGGIEAIGIRVLPDLDDQCEALLG